MKKYFTREEVQEILKTNELGAPVSYITRENKKEVLDNYIIYQRINNNSMLFSDDTIHIKKILLQVTHFHKKKLDSIDDLILKNFGVEAVAFDIPQLDQDYLATYYRFEILTGGKW